MEKNDSFTPQEKKSNNRHSMIISLMVMAVLLVADLYVMTNMSWNIIALLIVTLLFLISAYFFGNSIIKELQENKQRAEEQYDAITKANKASYILLKKAFEQIEEMESKSKKPTEEIITAQKAIAKVTISRNKENADAMMNSNDKVLEKIFDFEENLGNNQNEMLDKQKIMIDDSMKELMLKQQEIASSMKAMEESIKSELLQAMNSMQVVQAQATVTARELDMPVEDFSNEPMIDTGFAEEMSLGEDMNLGADLDLDGDMSLGEDIGLGEDLGLGEEMSLGEDLGLGEEISLGEDLGLGEEMSLEGDLGFGGDFSSTDDLGVSEELSLEDMGISEDMDFTDGLALSEEMSLGEDLGLGEEMSLGDDFGLSEEMSLGEDLGLGEEMSLGEDFGLSEDLDFAEDLGISSDLDLGIDLLPEDEPVAEPMMEEEVVEEPEFAEEDTSMPDLSNPNKLMTPDEIAALIAKM